MSVQEKIVVVGAGQMGLGIAHAFAVAGMTVTMVDVSADALERARASIAGIIEDGVRLGKVTRERADGAMAGLSASQNVGEAVVGAALVIETASENLGVKLAIIREADAAVSSDAILATNTSALSITEIAAASSRPERVVGMHFFNPVHKMKLVELIRGLQTADDTVESVKGWSDRIGKTSIVVNEAPGFTTSRISALLGNEAMWMLSEGVATAEDIDTSLRLAFNHPMGPLELGDLTGWDTRLAVLRHLHETLGEKFRPCPLVTKMVQAGRYGRKVGHGVYKYVDGVKVPNSGLRTS
jgi:3-hydroxybutyryl-CoA dehydrogenase